MDEGRQSAARSTTMPRPSTRSTYIKFRLRADEHAALRAAAEAEGMTPGQYARRNVLDRASLDAIAARLSDIAARIAQAPTRDEIRADFSTVAKAVAASVKSAASTTSTAATRTTP